MRKPSFTAMLVVTLLAATASYGAETAYEQHLAKGIAAMEAKSYAEAENEFRAASAEKPDDAIATLYLGIAKSRTGDREAEALLQQAYGKAPDNPRVNYELGAFYYSRAQYDEAAEHFGKTIRIAPGTEMSRNAEKYMSAIKGKGAAKRWTASLTMGGQYDTNVVVGPEDKPLPAVVSRQSDTRVVVLAKGRYYLLPGEKDDLSVGYGWYRSYHRDLARFDMSQHVLDVKGGRSLSPAIQLRGAYSYEFSYLGGELYNESHVFNPSLVISEGKGWSTVLDYKWRKNFFDDTIDFSTNSDRTGFGYAYGVTQNLKFEEYFRLKAGYARDVDKTLASHWSYVGDRLVATFSFPLPFQSFLDLTWDYSSKAYGAIYPSAGVERRDNTHAVTATAGIPFCERYAVFGGYSYITNSSTVPDFTYTRGITSIFLNARF